MAFPETIGRFTIVRQVGIGGMGTVYEALDPQIDRRVALKVLRRDMLVQNPELIERLWVEARAANSIRHPGVVQVSEAQRLDDGTGFLVMEFLDGQTLTQRLRQTRGKLPTAQALQIAIQIASTLSAGHQRGIIHRDVKPDNVMVVPDDAVSGGERVKLLDFGIAKISSNAANSAPLTLNDMSLGTPGYMAPEQMCNAINASDRSDVYGLGAVLFEMLSARRPLVAPSTAELIVLLLSQDPPLLTSLVNEAPSALSALLARMLQREPASARPTIVEVLRELILISSTLTTQSTCPSGPVELTGSLPIESSLVPPTFAKIPPRTSANSQRLTDKSVVLHEHSKATPPPSASTISQMTGQTGPAGPNPTGPGRRYLISGVTLGVLALSGAAWWVLKTQSAVVSSPNVEPAASVSGSSPTDLSAYTPELLQPHPPVAPQAAAQPLKQPTAPEKPAGRVRKPLRGVIPDAGCIQGAGLSLQARRSIATVFNKAEVLLLPGDVVSLIRQGNGLEVNSTPPTISDKKVMNIVRMLETALPQNALPEGLKRVYIQCSVKE